MASCYFAANGDYGDADGLIVLSVAQFTEDDWKTIEAADDEERASVARQIARSKH